MQNGKAESQLVNPSKKEKRTVRKQRNADQQTKPASNMRSLVIRKPVWLQRKDQQEAVLAVDASELQQDTATPSCKFVT